MAPRAGAVADGAVDARTGDGDGLGDVDALGGIEAAGVAAARAVEPAVGVEACVEDASVGNVATCELGAGATLVGAAALVDDGFELGSDGYAE